MLLICHLRLTLNTGLVDITFDRYISRWKKHGGTYNNVLWCKKNGLQKKFKTMWLHCCTSAQVCFAAITPNLSLIYIYLCLYDWLLSSVFHLLSVFFRVYRTWETPRPDSSMRPTFQIASEDLKQTSILHHESTEINDLKGVQHFETVPFSLILIPELWNTSSGINMRRRNTTARKWPMGAVYVSIHF